jgi:hypothetical protein
MTKALADARRRAMKEVEKRIGKPPRHVCASEVDPQIRAGVQSGYSVFNPFQVKESMMSTKDAQAGKPTLVDAMAKRKEREDARIAKAAEKERVRAAKEAERITRREQKAAERQARKEAATSDGPMAALRDAKKRYVKSATGQFRTADELGEILDAVPPDRIVALMLEVLGLPGNPYIFLNRGQQSMNLRNKLRFAVKKGTITLAAVAGARDRGQYTLTEEQLLEAEAARKAQVSRRFS